MDSTLQTPFRNHKASGSYTDVFLKPYGADPPQSYLEEYANLFIIGYQMVVRSSYS
jgi:hypothetical protein